MCEQEELSEGRELGGTGRLIASLRSLRSRPLSGRTGPAAFRPLGTHVWLLWVRRAPGEASVGFAALAKEAGSSKSP